MAYKQNNPGRSSQILAQVSLDVLKPAAQVFASTLAAELAMARNQPKAALTALNHPSLQSLKDLPPEQQIRTASVHARAYEADGQTLAAARERVAMAPLLTGDAAKSNHEAIWVLIAALPAEQLQASGNLTLDGWITLAQAVKGAGTLEQQQAAIDTWRAQNPPPGCRATANATDQAQGTGQPAPDQDRPAAATGWPAGLRRQSTA